MFAVQYGKIIKFGLTTAAVIGGLLLFPFLLNLFAPFAAAFVIAALMQRLVRILERRANISRGVSSAVLVTLIVAIITGAAVFAAYRIFIQLKNFAFSMPSAIESLRRQLFLLSEKYNGYKLRLSPEISTALDSAAEQLRSYADNITETIVSGAVDRAKRFAAAVPGMLFFLIMFILGTFFFTKDYILIINFLKEIFSDKVIKKCIQIKSILTHAFSSYFKAQLILMIITVSLVCVLLWIAGMEYPLVWGLVCGAVDALPVFGTAVILLPWAAISLIYGDVYSCVALLIIQVIVFVVRQLSEPHIVSRQIGIHPILTLVSVYVGLKLFGTLGMILAPVLTLLAANLYVAYKETEK